MALLLTRLVDYVAIWMKFTTIQGEYVIAFRDMSELMVFAFKMGQQLL